MSENLLTIPEVASMFRVPVARAYELARIGAMPGVVRIGRQVRVDPQKLKEFVDKGGKALAETAATA